MRNVLTVTLLSLFSVLAFTVQATESHHSDPSQTAQSAVQEDVISATGVIKEIDFDTKKVTIIHEAIPAISWPAMTMRFTFTSPEMLSGIKVGNNVDFDFIQQGNISLLKNIKVNES
ncbi:cation efflux system protein CusF [Yersinia pekkanenii]|uniref:Efflux system protein n=1 Tax=Yersinia pekkanenii TaxID=1288385 RepID=A0A0T9Q131_9GAMM|nr:cation efflux system protein CusF [Yersinia pekkanenii]CNH91300.1 putative efflux system protein [Yersinia pekkanenii]CRY67746.1 putative efflux system protein [Yersinia pekkanenii]